MVGLASSASFEEEESCDALVLKGIQGLAVQMQANCFNLLVGNSHLIAVVNEILFLQESSNTKTVLTAIVR